MPGSLVSLLAELRRRLVEVDGVELSGAGWVVLARDLALTEKACAAARARVAARAAASGAHRACGFRDAADWLASVTGSSAGAAKAELDTAAALDTCPRTRSAVAAGELSLSQAKEITRAEQERPGSEAELVALAKRSSLAALRDEARRRRFAAVDVEVLHARQHAARSVRHWRDDLGMVCGRFALPPEVGVPFVHRLEAGTDRVRRAARRSGSTEDRAAHAADAFAALVGGGGEVGGRGADVVDREVDGCGRDGAGADRLRSGDGGGGDDGPGDRDGGGGVGGGGVGGGGVGGGGVGGDGGGGDDRPGDRDGGGGGPGSRDGSGGGGGPGSRDGGGGGGGPGSRDGGGGGGRRGGGRRGGGSARPAPRRADLVIVCDRRAWARGHAHAGEPCHVVGGTPIPVAVAKRLGADAFVKAVVHDGTRIDTVVHWGRHIPAEVRTALELGSPPGFDGAVCVEPGCGRRDHLEWDHVNPVANRGPTSYGNLVARCWPHHHDKTERDRAAGLLGARATGRDPP